MSADAASQKKLGVCYATESEFLEEYAGSLIQSAVFSPTTDAASPGDSVTLTLDLAFCSQQLELEGDVVAVVPPAMQRVGATPGVSIQLASSPETLRGQLEGLTGLALKEIRRKEPDSKRQFERFPARTSSALEVMNRHFPAETVDVSYNGMLALLPGLDLAVGTDMTITLSHPKTEERLSIPGRVVNQARCDYGYMAIGVQFFYEVERIDEVMAFVDNLCSFHRARELATVSGSVSDTRLEDVFETFSAISSAGTLSLTQGEQSGKVAYSDAKILYATTGLVSGTKALSRMFTWSEARFDFQPSVDPLDTSEPPFDLESAVVTAAIHRDEIARLNVGALHLDTTFEVDASQLELLKGDLESVGLEISEHARMGFPLGAILDILTESDASIYRALAKLVDAGVLSWNE